MRDRNILHLWSKEKYIFLLVAMTLKKKYISFDNSWHKIWSSIKINKYSLFNSM